MTRKVSTIQNNEGDPRGLNYALNYTYEGTPHRASRIGDIQYEYDGNGNVVQEYYGTGTVTGRGEHPLYEEDGIYSTDYGFALREGTGGSIGTNERRYEWNERNQLRASVDSQWQVRYRYGADGQRAVKYGINGANHSETLYFNKMVHVGYVQPSVYGEATESKHIYVGETRIVTKHRAVGNIDHGQETVRQYYYHGDHLGSAQLVTNYEGALYEHIEYTPYGELWIEHRTEEGNVLPFRFTAKEYDRETGLYYYGARYLDPRTSRWISTDPAMGEYIPDAPINDDVKKNNQNLPGMGGVFNYVNLHVYHYAGNNPVKLVDPDGDSMTVIMGIVGAVAGGAVAAITEYSQTGKVSFRNVAGGVAGGAIAGAMAGSVMDTFGTSALVIAGTGLTPVASLASGAMSSTVGGGVSDVISGRPITVKSVATDALYGAGLQAAGAIVTKAGEGATALANKQYNNYMQNANTQSVAPLPVPFKDTLNITSANERTIGSIAETVRKGVDVFADIHKNMNDSRSTPNKNSIPLRDNYSNW